MIPNSQLSMVLVPGDRAYRGNSLGEANSLVHPTALSENYCLVYTVIAERHSNAAIERSVRGMLGSTTSTKLGDSSLDA